MTCTELFQLKSGVLEKGEDEFRSDPHRFIIKIINGNPKSDTKLATITGGPGHLRIIWSKLIPEQLKEARDKFYELLDQGYTMFAVLANGQQSGRKILSFEDCVNVEEVVAVLPTRGG